MATWDYAHCLPYFKRMETCLAAAPDDPWRGHDGPLVLERGPATNPLFTAFFAACQEAGYHLTEDVNGYRQEGFAPFDRNIHRGPPAERRAGLPAPGHAAARTSTVRTRTFVTGVVFEGRRAVGVEIERQGGGTETHRGRRGHPVPAARSTRRSSSSCRASGAAADLDGARHPGRGRPAGRRRPPPGPPRGLHPVQVPPAGLDAAVGDAEVAPAVHRGAVAVPAAAGPGATNHFEGGGFARSNDDVAYPNLMFHFLPLAIRYDGSAGAAGPRLPGPRRADVLRRPRVASRSRRTDPHEHPALRFNYLSTEQDRREWVEAVRVARRILNQPAMAPVQRRRDVARAGRSTTDDEIRDWVARDAETALHPSCTARMGVDDASVLDPLTMRVHGLDGLRVVDASVDAVRHQRQHLRAGDDARREGRRPHPRQHAAAARADRRSTGTSRAEDRRRERPASRATDRAPRADIDGCPCRATDARRMTAPRAAPRASAHPLDSDHHRQGARPWKPSARAATTLADPFDLAAFAAELQGELHPSRAAAAYDERPPDPQRRLRPAPGDDRPGGRCRATSRGPSASPRETGHGARGPQRRPQPRRLQHRRRRHRRRHDRA